MAVLMEAPSTALAHDIGAGDRRIDLFDIGALGGKPPCIISSV